LTVGQIVVGMLIGAYLLYYAFRDGPRCFDAIEARLPMRTGLLRDLAGTAAVQFRRYMLGTTAIAVMDAAVIALGALVLGLPLLGAIAMVTFVAAFVPYVGAWISAAFAVVLALGTGGLPAAGWMLVIVLIAQNILEGILRPAIFGRALACTPWPCSPSPCWAPRSAACSACSSPRPSPP